MANQHTRKASDVEAPEPVGLKVRATQRGYYNHGTRRSGDVFTLHRSRDFSAVWMEHVPEETPTTYTGPEKALRDAHTETMQERASASNLARDADASPVG